MVKALLEQKNEMKVSGHREYRQLDENFCNKEEQRNEVIARGEFWVEKIYFFKTENSTKYFGVDKKE